MAKRRQSKIQVENAAMRKAAQHWNSGNRSGFMIGTTKPGKGKTSTKKKKK